MKLNKSFKMRILPLTLICVFLSFGYQNPKLQTNPEDQSSKVFDTKEEHVDEIFFEDFNHIDSKIWRVAGWTEHGGKTSPDRCYAKDGFLNMIFIHDPEEGNLGSAIQTEVEFFYGRWEARLKPSNVPGVLNSFYTIDWDNTVDPSADNDGTKQEIDIEFLTKSFKGSSGEVHIALHARGRKVLVHSPISASILILLRSFIHGVLILHLIILNGLWIIKSFIDMSTKIMTLRLILPIC